MRNRFKRLSLGLVGGLIAITLAQIFAPASAKIATSIPVPTNVAKVRVVVAQTSRVAVNVAAGNAAVGKRWTVLVASEVAHRAPDVVTIAEVNAEMGAARVPGGLALGEANELLGSAPVDDILTLPTATPAATATPIAVTASHPRKYKSGPAVSLPVRESYAATKVAGGRGFSVVGPPTISADTIAWVLKRYGSPSVPSAEAFYNLGVKYGIDPAFMLAHYLVESTGGTAGAAVETKNIGNIICTDDWLGAGGTCSGRWRVYASDVAGAEDWYKLISGPGYVGMGLVTPEQIVPKYAPLGDCNATKTMCNDPALYTTTVEQLVTWFRQLEQTSRK